MNRRSFVVLSFLGFSGLRAADSDYQSARRKIALIESNRLRPGSRVSLYPRELTAYAEYEARKVSPDGIRDLKLKLGNDVATGSALVDFGKIQRARGESPNWLMAQLLDGERPVRVTARIISGAGQATVDVERVEISDVTIEGQLLDFLIENYVIPRYPDAKIGRPFELSHRIDKIEVTPSAVGVLIGR